VTVATLHDHPAAAAHAARVEPGHRRRLLVLVDQYHGPYGGTEGQIHTLLRHLPSGWDAELWVLRKSAWFEESDLPYPTRVLGVRSLGSLRTYLRVRRIARDVRKAGFDLIHTFMNDASVVGALLARRAGTPLVISRRDLGFWQTPRWLHMLRRTDRFASAVLANAAAVARHTTQAEHVPPALVHVVHNGQDPARFDVAPTPGLRERLGVPPAAPLVGLLANVKALKRQDDLIEGFLRLRDRHPALHVWFIGDDPGDDPPDQPRLVERVKARGLGGRVHVFRAERDAIAVLKHLDIGVLCSETEGLSNAILEYLGCGLPVVATDVGGNPDLVRHGENGWLYPPGDVDALTRHLDTLLSDPARARAMGAASRVRFERELTVDRMVAETTRRYEAVLAPPTEEAALSFEVVEDLAALEALAADWQALLGPRQLFAGPDWVLTALRHGGGRRRPHVLVARDGAGRLVGLLPLERSGRGVLAYAGQSLGGDHLDVVAAPGLAERVAAGALDHLAGLRWRRLRLRHLAEDGALRLAIRRLRWRLPYHERVATICPYLSIRGTYSGFLDAHPSKTFRRNVRRYVKRFLETEGAAFERVREPEKVGAAVDRFYALHAQRFEVRGERSAVTEDLRGFHRALAERAARAGRVALAFLRLGERDVACEYAFLDGHTMYAFQGGHDVECDVTSPGLVLRALILEHEVFGAGLASYDFLDGAEAYKARWTQEVRRLFDVEVHRPGRVGRAGCFLLGAPHLLRDLLRPQRASPWTSFEEDAS